ncbi:MAG TPA: hypothetical protein VL306_01030 [Methylomirabilota bacterium]|nr:hypothetical protein [Methylomirabilota bacterium]
MQKINWSDKTKLEQAGISVVKILKASGFQAFWVGGVVRNILLNRESDNLDIATDATPEEVEKVLDQAKVNNKPVGKKFGSILAILDNQKIEITTFRAEGRYSDNRHPDQVQFIKGYIEDAKRRDFTINALYFDPIKKKLSDPTNGLKDLKAKLLRFVGNPKKRIDEDALRMLRGVRLATQLGFKLEKNSFAAIKTRAKYIQGISGERIKAELDKILLSDNRAEGIKLLDQIGLLRFILPEIGELKKVFHKSKRYHLEGSVFEHTLLVLQSLPPDIDLLYAGMFHDLGKIREAKKVYKNNEWVNTFHGHWDVSRKFFAEFAKKYRFSKKSKSLTDFLIKEHDRRPDFFSMSEQKRIKYAMHEDFPKLLDVWAADSAGNLRITENDQKIPGNSKSVILGREVLKQINSKKSLIENLAQGDVVMKYSHLMPGRELGQKIQDVTVQIVMGRIYDEKTLRKYLEV